MAKQTSNNSESASACAVAGSTPEASLTSSLNALNCHVDPLRLSPATSTLKSFAFADVAQRLEPTFLSESRGASRVTFIEVWRCFFLRSTCVLFSTSSSLRSLASSALSTVVARAFATSSSLRSAASSAVSTGFYRAFASV